MASDQSIYDDIVNSVGYKTTVGPVDRGKVKKAIEGQPSTSPSSRLGRAAWHLARRINPVLPKPPDPPPPPPTYKKVAPRVAYKAGNSDARYCCVNQPGVVWIEAIKRWKDEVATYDDNYLCTDGRRSDGDRTNTITSALEIDGRDYCSLPTQGDPTKNTGSWTI